MGGKLAEAAIVAALIRKLRLGNSEKKEIRSWKLVAMAGMVIFDCRQIVLDSGILHRTGHYNREID